MIDALHFLAPPVALAVLLVGIHSYLGLHVLAREVIFVDIGLSQVAALGAALSMFWRPEGEGSLSLICSLGLCLLTAAALALLRRWERKLSQEVLIGMTYALASGLLVLVTDRLPHGTEHLKHAMVGNILFVSWRQVVETGLVYAAVGIVHWIFRRQFWSVSTGAGVSFAWDFFFYFLFGVVITFSTHHAGVLVVFAALVAPAALARRFLSTVGAQLKAAWGIGLACMLAAFAVSYVWDLPAGPSIVALMGAVFFAVVAGAIVRDQIKSRMSSRSRSSSSHSGC
ncbi:MAG: metal ABC transporter permease [Bdellovibrionales bacterium]|nr:metal ABC transporter permease [Bdellovibrionales bacterium]